MIDANKINIYSLAKTSGLERTAIYKIIFGSRIPSDEYAYKLADTLPLSPEERQRLLESFNISKIGEYKYRQRIQVKDLINSIAYIENEIIAPVSAADAADPPLLNEANATAYGYFAVNNLVKSVIEESVTDTEKQEIDFVVPENYGYF